MSQQVMVRGVVFGLRGDEVVLQTRSGNVLPMDPRRMRDLGGNDRAILMEAVDRLAALSPQGEIIKRKYA